MRKKISFAIIAAVAFFGIVCVPSGRADEEFALLPTAVPSTTVSGGDISDITMLTDPFAGSIGVPPSGFSVSPVPEPSAAGFFATGILLLIILAKFKSQSFRAISPAVKNDFASTLRFKTRQHKRDFLFTAISEGGLDCPLGQVYCFFADRSSCARLSGSLALGQSVACGLTIGEALARHGVPSYLKSGGVGLNR